MLTKLNLSLASAVTAAALLFAPAVSATPSVPAECGLVAHWASMGPVPGGPYSFDSVMAGSCGAGVLNSSVQPSIMIDTQWAANIMLPNFIDDLPIKEIWIHVMTWLSPNDFNITVAGYDPTVTGAIPGVSHDVTTLPDGFIEHFWIQPNPDYETISIVPLIDFAAPKIACIDVCTTDLGPPILAVWIATVSRDIPEPGTLALFGLGLAGLGFARRKKGCLTR